MYTVADVKQVAKNNDISLQKALNALKKASYNCPVCKKQSMLEYYHSDGVIVVCLLCDYEIE